MNQNRFFQCTVMAPLSNALWYGMVMKFSKIKSFTLIIKFSWFKSQFNSSKGFYLEKLLFHFKTCEEASLELVNKKKDNV